MPTDLRIAICIPTAGMVSAWFAHSLVGMTMSAQAQISARRDAPSIAVTCLVMESSVIHMNRENLVLEAQKWNATHVMFLDDDMVFDSRVLAILLGRRQAFVACNYPRRGWPITFTAVRPGGKGHIITDKDATGLEEAEYTGFGVSLIETQVFEKTVRPWFLPEFVPHLDSYTTEDNPFCRRVREAGFSVYVDHDASKLVSHRGVHGFSWEQYRQPEPDKASAEIVELKGAKA
jgi:hypothetical protein